MVHTLLLLFHVAKGVRKRNAQSLTKTARSMHYCLCTALPKRLTWRQMNPVFLNPVVSLYSILLTSSTLMKGTRRSGKISRFDLFLIFTNTQFLRTGTLNSFVHYPSQTKRLTRRFCCVLQVGKRSTWRLITRCPPDPHPSLPGRTSPPRMLPARLRTQG